MGYERRERQYLKSNLNDIKRRSNSAGNTTGDGTGGSINQGTFNLSGIFDRLRGTHFFLLGFRLYKLKSITKPISSNIKPHKRKEINFTSTLEKKISSLSSERFYQITRRSSDIYWRRWWSCGISTEEEEGRMSLTGRLCCRGIGWW